VGHRADLRNLRTSHTSLREELAKQLPLKDRKKTGKAPQPPGETKTELLLKYQHQDWMLKSNTRTTKTEILFFQNLEFFLCICLFVLFPACPPPLPVDFFGSLSLFFFFFLCFISFTTVS
jgi:hypothetical protein